MLEEALLDEKRNPSEAAQAMLQFVQFELTAGGASAEARFYYKLFGPLCERIFGEMTTTTTTDVQDTNKNKNVNAICKFQHKPGGWLSAPSRWSRLPVASSSSSSSTATVTHPSRVSADASASSSGSSGGRSLLHTNTSTTTAPAGSSSWDSDPVVKLLATTTSYTSSSSSSSSILRKKHNMQSQQVVPPPPPLPPTLVEAISSESEHRPGVGFSFPFEALPRATQEAWMAVLELELEPSRLSSFSTFSSQQQQQQPIHMNTRMGRVGGSNSSSSLLPVVTDNDKRLFGQVLRKTPMDQPTLLRLRQQALLQQQHQQQQQSIRTSSPLHQAAGAGSSRVVGGGGGVGLPPRSFPFPTTPSSSYAASSQQQQQQARMMMLPPNRSLRGGIVAGNDSNKPEKAEDNVILSMLEYYLVLFLRFPLAHPLPFHFYRDNSIPFGEMVYIYLFTRYLGHFLPYTADQGRSIVLLINMNANMINNMNNPSIRPSSNFLQSELFLRLTLSLWMEAPMRLVPTANVLESLLSLHAEQHPQQQQQYRRNIGTATGTTTTATTLLPLALQSLFTLDRSYDLVQIHKDFYFQPPPSHVKSCLKKLVMHLLADPALRESMTTVVTTSSSTSSAPLVLLPHHALWVTQPSFYNYIRAAFRFASIHTSDRAFFSALDLWLLWLEPWNFVWKQQHSQHKPKMQSRQFTQPKYNEASKYDPVWEPYIAANLHLYLTPLAIFLRRSRELDFSARAFESSIRIVKRVFRVFPPAVVSALTRNYSRLVGVSSSTTTPSTTSGSASLLSLVQQHMERLGQFAPPLPPPVAEVASFLSPLASCQGDMHSLLEEVHMQHLKKIRDLDMFQWLEAKVEGVFGMGVFNGEERELEDLVSRAKSIVGLPSDYQIAVHLEAVAATAAGSGEDSGGGQVLSRTKEGQLTQRGREQILRGEVKITPANITFARDKMRGGVRPHEIAVLVTATVFASDVINAKLLELYTTYIGSSDGSGTTAAKFRYRVNLRFLADYRNLSFTLLTLYIVFKMIF